VCEGGAAPPCIYLDNQATTPLDPRVLEAMMPCLRQGFGNASSKSHAYGWAAAEQVERARAQVADLIGAAAPREIIFTSGATEADNLAILGLCDTPVDGRNHIVTCVTEHPAVLDPCRHLERRGWRVSTVGVDAAGRLDVAQLDEAVTGDTALITVMAANNEIGTVHPLAEVGQLARARGVPWHCDAAQAAGKIPLDVEALGVDLLSLSGHKIYGPKGVGALYVRRRKPRLPLAAQQLGGGQERGLRSGTLNVPGIVGLGRACQLCAEELPGEGPRLAALRDRLHRNLDGAIPGVQLNGHRDHRLPGCLNVVLGTVDGGRLLAALRDVALSSGSACASGEGHPSAVLKALGRTDSEAFSSVRFGLGRFTTGDEVDTAARRVIEQAGRLQLN